MKRVTYLLLAGACFAFAAVACGEEGEKPAVGLEIDLAGNRLEFQAADDALATVRVKVAGGGAWSADPDREWIVVKTSDDKFTVSVRNFDSFEVKRTGTVTVSAAGAEPIEIEVVQFGKGATLAIAPERIGFPSFFYPTDTDEERQRRATVTTDAPEWTVVIDEKDAWLKLVAKTADEIVLTTGDNQYAERTAEVKVQAGSTIKTLTVTQEAALVPYGGFEGAYTASGKPSVWNGTVNEGPASWPTTFRAGSSDEGPYYLTDNFAGKGAALTDKANIYIDWLQGRPTIYSPVKLGWQSKEGVDAYQLLFIIKEDDLPYIIEGSKDGAWDPESGVMDFSGENQGYDIVLGIVAVEYVGGDPVIKGMFTEGYADLKFTAQGSSATASRAVRTVLPHKVEPRLEVRNPGPAQRKMNELPRLR